MIVVFGGLLGLAVAGFPSRESDQPLEVRSQPAASTSTSTSAPTTSAPASTPPTSLRPAGDVRVMVFNASDVTGVATRVGARLKAQGWDVGSPGAGRPAQNNSIVMYRADFDDEARSLAGGLALPTSAVVALDTAVVSPGDADLAVIVGDELAERVG